MSPIRERNYGRTGVEYISEEQGQFAGHLVVSKKRKTAKIGWINVSNKFRGMGIASDLLEEAERWAREKGCNKITASLSPTPGSERNAVNLLESHGYTVSKKGEASKRL